MCAPRPPSPSFLLLRRAGGGQLRLDVPEEGVAEERGAEGAPQQKLHQRGRVVRLQLHRLRASKPLGGPKRKGKGENWGRGESRSGVAWAGAPRLYRVEAPHPRRLRRYRVTVPAPAAAGWAGAPRPSSGGGTSPRTPARARLRTWPARHTHRHTRVSAHASAYTSRRSTCHVAVCRPGIYVEYSAEYSKRRVLN
eukprot:2877973-Pyramimonas_sp.AAC.1